MPGAFPFPLLADEAVSAQAAVPELILSMASWLL